MSSAAPEMSSAAPAAAAASRRRPRHRRRRRDPQRETAQQKPPKRIRQRRRMGDAERPAGTLFMNQYVRCVGSDGVPLVRTLKDLLLGRCGAAEAEAEADTPCMRPSAAPIFAQSELAGTQGAHRANGPHNNNNNNSNNNNNKRSSMNDCGREMGHSASSPMITFTLDGVATPKTFAVIKHQLREMDVARLPDPATMHSAHHAQADEKNKVEGDDCAGGSVRTRCTLAQDSHLHVASLSSPLRLHELPHQYLLRHFTGGSSGGFSFYRTLEEKGQFAALCRDILAQACPIFEAEPLFPQIAAPAFVFGDIHGNFEDLAFFLRNVLTFHDLHLTPANILCLGDYVDRGPYSLECLMLLLSLKVLHPAKVVLLRGNHEDRVVCGDVLTYGSSCFLAQCEAVFGSDEGRAIFREATDLFRHFPLAAELVIPNVPNTGLPANGGATGIGPSWPPVAVPSRERTQKPQHERRVTHEERVLCTHGGIPRFSAPPKDDDSLAFLRHETFPRLLTLFPNNPAVRDDPAALADFFATGTGTDTGTAAAQGALLRKAWYVAFDLMWSDPTSSDPGDEAAGDERATAGQALDEWGFGVNTRGSNVLSFSSKAVEAFLGAHRYSMLFRAHQEKAHGLWLSKSSKVLTIFSSSNYLGHGNGAGCVVVAANGEIQLVEKLSR